MNIPTLREGKRGCGFRKPGGLYLRSEGRGRPCGLIPIPLESCPCCGAGIKFSRGWTWVDIGRLVAINPDPCKNENGCGDCPLADAKIGKAGLIWIGEKFYPTPESFLLEADAMGISRRIHSVPRNFILGETWIALAHIRAIPAPILTEEKPKRGIFRLFRPTAIEYVVTGKESEEELESLVKRGIKPVKVVPLKDGEIL